MNKQHLYRDDPAAMVHELAVLKHAFEVTARERDWLRQELTTAREREHDYRDQLAWLRRRLEQSEQRAVCVVTPARAEASSRAPATPVPTDTAPVPRQERRAQIRAWLHAHPGPHSCKAIEQGVGLSGLRDTLRHMVNAGILSRISPGVFQA